MQMQKDSEGRFLPPSTAEVRKEIMCCQLNREITNSPSTKKNIFDIALEAKSDQEQEELILFG